MSRFSASMSTTCQPMIDSIQTLSRGSESVVVPRVANEILIISLGVNEAIPLKNWSVYQALQGPSTVLDGIQRRPGAEARIACNVFGECGVGAPLPWSIPGQANWPGLARALSNLWWLLT